MPVPDALELEEPVDEPDEVPVEEALAVAEADTDDEPVPLPVGVAVAVEDD